MVYRLRSHHGPGVSYIVIGKKVMATEKKDRPWDGRSRPSTDLYKKNFDKIFKKEKTLHEELMEGYEEEKKLNDE